MIGQIKNNTVRATPIFLGVNGKNVRTPPIVLKHVIYQIDPVVLEKSLYII